MNKLCLPLIKKDFAVQRPFVRSYLISSLFVGGIVVIIGELQVLVPLLTFQFLFTFTMASFYADEQNKAYRFLLSMPISRDTVVTARYLSVLLLAAVLLPVLVAVQAGIEVAVLALGFDMDVSGMAPTTVAYALAGMLLVLSLYLPINFKLGMMKSSMYSRLLFMVIVVGALSLGWLQSWLATQLEPETFARLTQALTSLNSWVPVAALILLALGCVAISHKVAVRIFASKEI